MGRNPDPCTIGMAGHFRHYMVVSPTMYPYSYMEPPEPYACVGIYLTRTAKDARVAAVKDSEFADWVLEARGDRMPPFKGLEVTLTRCEHGVCWGCHGTEESSGCAKCDALHATDS